MFLFPGFSGCCGNLLEVLFVQIRGSPTNFHPKDHPGNMLPSWSFQGLFICPPIAKSMPSRKVQQKCLKRDGHFFFAGFFQIGCPNKNAPIIVGLKLMLLCDSRIAEPGIAARKNMNRGGTWKSGNRSCILSYSNTWNPKQPFINGCFNWMIPNLYIGNGCFTKHPFLNGCLGFQEHIL